jgi:hypothetical protein
MLRMMAMCEAGTQGGTWIPRTDLFKDFMFLTWCLNLVEFQNSCDFVVGLAYQGKDIVFRFIIEYSSLRYFDP